MLHRPMLARNIMVTRLVTLSSVMDVFEAIGLLLRHRISGAPVVDPDGNYVGVFSEKESMRVLLDAAVDSLPCTSVDGFVERDARTIDEETDLLTIAHLFHTTSSRRLPVLRGNQLVGQVSRRDVLRAAFDMLNMAPDRETGLLYVSSILDRKEAPIA